MKIWIYDFLNLVVFAQEEAIKVAAEPSLLNDIMRAGIVVQLLLLTLIGMSVISWAIMISKNKQVKAIAEDNMAFEKMFWQTDSFDTIFDKADNYTQSSMARIFKSGYKEMQKLAEMQKGEEGARLTGIENLERSLRRAMDIELAFVENRVSWLATIGSTSPFIGLLGTVVGIMNSFRGIAIKGSASLATVAPGISEALFATAIGLFAAIPAVVAYNHFLNKIKRLEVTMNNFANDYMNLAKRNFF